MKKSDLKQLIKPVVKECIHEVLIEEGLLSNVVAEVAKGMQGNLVVEAKQQPRQQTMFEERAEKSPTQMKQKMEAQRQKLLDAIGRDAYNNVDLFEGTTPTKSAGSPNGAASMPSVLGDDPNDAGVDISSLMGGAKQIWKAMK